MPLANVVTLDTTAPSASVMKYVTNKNNIMEMRLRKTLSQFSRQKAANLSHLDQQRLDVHDFLRDIRRCASDLTPESKRWLGEREGYWRRTKSSRQEKRKVATAPCKKAPLSDRRLLQNRDSSPPKTAPPKGVPESRPESRLMLVGSKMARTPLQQKNVQTSTTIPTAQEVKTAWDGMLGKRSDFEVNSVKTDDRIIHTVAKENRVTVSTKRIKTRQNNEYHMPVLPYLPQAGATETKLRLEIDPTGHVSLVHIPVSFSSCRSNTANITSAAITTGLSRQETLLENQSVMQTIMAEKSQRRRHRKPLEVRISEFYSKLNDMKAEEEALMVPSWETRRKWTLMTKGLKAALAESSDEEDDSDKLHTV